MNSGDILEEIYVVIHHGSSSLLNDSQTLYNLGNILAPFPSYILRENHKDFIPRITYAGIEISWEEIVWPRIYHPQDLEIFNIAQPAKKVVQDTTMQLSPSHDDNRERSQECAGGAGNEQSNNNSAGAHPNTSIKRSTWEPAGKAKNYSFLQTVHSFKVMSAFLQVSCLVLALSHWKKKRQPLPWGFREGSSSTTSTSSIVSAVQSGYLSNHCLRLTVSNFPPTNNPPQSVDTKHVGFPKTSPLNIPLRLWWQSSPQFSYQYREKTKSSWRMLKVHWTPLALISPAKVSTQLDWTVAHEKSTLHPNSLTHQKNIPSVA